MDKLSIFGRTLGFHKAPFEIISRDPFSPMTKTVRLVCFVLPTRGPSTLSIYLFPIIFKILFTVFLLCVLLGWRTSSYGLTIRVLASLSPLLSFFTNSNMVPRTNHFGTGFGHYHVQKKSKSSSGKLCVTGYPPSNSSPLGVIIGITTVLDVIPRK